MLTRQAHIWNHSIQDVTLRLSDERWSPADVNRLLKRLDEMVGHSGERVTIFYKLDDDNNHSEQFMVGVWVTVKAPRPERVGSLVDPFNISAATVGQIVDALKHQGRTVRVEDTFHTRVEVEHNFRSEIWAPLL